jgi:hypothetical protein
LIIDFLTAVFHTDRRYVVLQLEDHLLNSVKQRNTAAAETKLKTMFSADI